MKRKVDVLIIGAGTAGLSAMSEVKKSGKSFILVDGGELGTTCARVGCMPSKALMQVSHDFHRSNFFSRQGIEGGGSLSINFPDVFEHVRDLRDIFVDRVLDGTTDQMGEEFVEGYAQFLEPGVVQVNDLVIHANSIVIACGTRPRTPPEWISLSDRVFTTDTLFEQENFSGNTAVIGLGMIGLELGQALANLGISVCGFDTTNTIANIKDEKVLETALQIFNKSFPINLGVKVEASVENDRLRVQAGDIEHIVDNILLSLGRENNLEQLKISKSGLQTDTKGVPIFDPHTMRCGNSRVFLAGDVTGSKQILHEASDEGKIAGYNAVRDHSEKFYRKEQISIAFTSPNICHVGIPFDKLNLDELAIGEMRMGPVGRALIMSANRGIIRLYVDRSDGRLLGSTILAERGENLAHLLAWCISEKMTVSQILLKPFYHPSIEEALQGALRDVLLKLDAPLDKKEIPQGLQILS